MTILSKAEDGRHYFAAMTELPSMAELIRKYDVPTPRYTSYPTVPHWNTGSFTSDQWVDAVRRCFEETNDAKGISLYIHLPFCESLCTYCACNKRITRNHGVEIDYIRTLLKEWELYAGIFRRKPMIRELHLGGGTPTFFSPQNLRWLVSYLLEESIVHPEREFSFEGHPNNTTAEHLQTLFNLGFKRVSFGVQDLDPKVQKTINRVQPFENLERVTVRSRDIGFQSVSFDLIYGLPFQTRQSIENTIRQVLTLKPDRVSFYSYAHVPWVSPGQRGYSEADLPSDVQKRALYEAGRALLKDSGYQDIGMDHFALPHDSLWQAQQHVRLHRNFMGYTTTNTGLLIGLGTSAISDAKYAYAQNLKKVEDYAQAIRNKTLAVFKGHIQTDRDRSLKQTILNIACHGHINNESIDTLLDPADRETLRGMLAEDILRQTDDGYHVTETGRAFIRNVCSIFDERLKEDARRNGAVVFSKSI